MTAPPESTPAPPLAAGLRRSLGAKLLLPVRVAYGLYAAAAFLGLGLLALLPLALVPSLAGRRRLIHWVARASLGLMGMPVTVRWHAPLPEHCIVVANHCSYLDGVVLAAVLPPRFDFVIKREMISVPLAGFLLRRIGVQFVTRGNRGGSVRDALRVIRSATSGGSLAFFPEGTFRHAPGLLRFHTGAFAAAERAGAPIVPLVIQGTRRRLAPGSILPRPGLIRARTLGPLWAVPGHPDSAAVLRDAARAAILEASGELDATEHA